MDKSKEIRLDIISLSIFSTKPPVIALRSLAGPKRGPAFQISHTQVEGFTREAVEKIALRGV